MGTNKYDEAVKRCGPPPLGRYLVVGERLRRGDKYPGHKEWQDIPECIVGYAIEVGHPTPLVRPERLLRPKKPAVIIYVLPMERPRRRGYR